MLLLLLLELLVLFCKKCGLLGNNVDVLLNIGLMNTTILVYGDNQELFTREIAIAGHHINLDLMKFLSNYYQRMRRESIQKLSI